MNDNPVVKHATWMAKHAVNSRMSPLNDNHDKDPVYSDRKNQQGESQVDIMKKRVDAVNNAVEAYKGGSGTYNAYEDALNKHNVSKDSITGANATMDKLFAEIKSGNYKK